MYACKAYVNYSVFNQVAIENNKIAIDQVGQ